MARIDPALTSTPERETWGSGVERWYNQGLAGIGRKLLDGARQVVDSKFGKWALLTGVATVVLMAAAASWMGPAHLLTIDKAALTAGEGFVAGAVRGAKFLFTGSGVATMAMGGLIGSTVLSKYFFKEPTPPSLEEAKKRGEDLAHARGTQKNAALPEKGQTPEKEQTPERTQDNGKTKQTDRPSYVDHPMYDKVVDGRTKWQTMHQERVAQNEKSMGRT